MGSRAPPPLDPTAHAWQQHVTAYDQLQHLPESVLSTRSLSYLSVLSAIDASSATFPGPTTSRNGSLSSSFARNPPTRQGTMNTDDSDFVLEMAPNNKGDRGLNDIPELPDSVAESPLFTLPREIRDRIYSFCLTTDDDSVIEWPSLPATKPSHILSPQLIRACRIVHDEATPLLYSQNTLTFHHPSDANMFVRAISSRHHSIYISNLSIHIKAADTRLWMPYLTSTDERRSLKADFPNIRDLGVRFRSNKWNHALPPDVNMKLWAEDNRLEEIIDGLRQHLIPPAAVDPMRLGRDGKTREFTENSFLDYIDRRQATETFNHHRGSADFSARKDAHRAHRASASGPPPNAHIEAPTIRIICACRVHPTQFAMLTGSAPMPETPINFPHLQHLGVVPPPPPPPPVPPHHVHLGAAAPVDHRGMQGHPGGPPPLPVREGEPYRGFTAVDLRGPGVVRRLSDAELGSANVARTPFADKNGIYVSLEVHCLDPKRD